MREHFRVANKFLIKISQKDPFDSYDIESINDNKYSKYISSILDNLEQEKQYHFCDDVDYSQ